MRTLLAAALLAATTTSALAQAPAHRFKADGETITYSAARDARGIVHLRGQAGVEAFDLAVRGRTVDGFMGDNRVSFEVPAQTVAEVDSQLAADQVAVTTTPSAALAAN